MGICRSFRSPLFISKVKKYISFVLVPPFMRKVLKELLRGNISLESAEERLRNRILNIDDFANIDVNREARVGIPEIILCEGKTTEQVKEIVKKSIAAMGKIILSKVPEDMMKALTDLPFSIKGYPQAKMAVITSEEHNKNKEARRTRPLLGVVTGGTVDIPIATEAVVCAREMGCDVFTAFDVGVAGIHRLLPVIKEMNEKRIRVVIVAAGREGALPSVVAGLVNSVVIGLPVSSGYGCGGKGKAALYGMLQSCTPLLVVNIDAGVIAGMMAAKMLLMR